MRFLRNWIVMFCALIVLAMMVATVSLSIAAPLPGQYALGAACGIGLFSIFTAFMASMADRRLFMNRMVHFCRDLRYAIGITDCS